MIILIGRSKPRLLRPTYPKHFFGEIMDGEKISDYFIGHKHKYKRYSVCYFGYWVSLNFSGNKFRFEIDEYSKRYKDLIMDSDFYSNIKFRLRLLRNVFTQKQYND